MTKSERALTGKLCIVCSSIQRLAGRREFYLVIFVSSVRLRSITLLVCMYDGCSVIIL